MIYETGNITDETEEERRERITDEFFAEESGQR